ncbi:MAG TPA: TIR domain-containing protein, partial [Ktedonobacterales bacterium]
MPSDQPAQPPRVPSAAAVAAKPAPRHSHLPTALRVVAVLIFIAAAAYLAHAFWSGIQYAVTPQADDTGIVPNVVSLPGLGLSLGVELAIGLVMLALFVGSTILLLATRTRYLGAPELAAPAPLAERPAAEPAPEHPGATPVAQAVQFVPRVFISHSRADDEFGHKLVARLRTELGDDDSVWYDSAGGLWAGDEWWMRILKELSERNVFLIVLSPDSMASKWCQDELNLAWQDKNSKDRSRRKVIVPVMYRTTEVPQYLTIVQFADFTNDERFEEAFERLVRVVRAGRTVEVVPSVESGPPFDLALLPLPTHFVGREAELSWLREHLAEGATTLGIVAVNGLGGIGKTGLAAKAVRDLRAGGRFPDGIAVVLCQDKRSEGDALLILANVLTRFDPFRRAPEATDIVGLSEVARRLLLGKDVLIVLDNVEPELPIALVVAPLREAGATVLLTARSLLPADVVPPEGRLPLDLLTETEALDLLAKSLGNYEASDLSADELQAARRIVASLDRHTLAVTLAGAYVADGRDLATLAAELADPQRALRLPKGNVPDAVKHAFLSSYDALSDDARKLFTALSALPTLNFSREAAAALGKGVGLPEAETDVDALARLALATSLPGDRLRLHPLIQALADAEFATWPLPERNSAYLAMVRYYAAYSKHATDVGREADEDNIAGALVRAATLEQESLVGEIAEGMQTYWRERSQSEAASRASLGERNVRREAKARVDEREFVRLANLDYSYAELQMHLGDVDTAERYLSQSVENYR